MGRIFGTDGVRGIANSTLTCSLSFEIGRAAASVLSDGCRHRPALVIGSDTRASSDMLVASVTAGICSVGADVIQLGTVPTPAVAYLVSKYKADAGIMVSASHNPAEFNGIKLFGKNGFKLPDMLVEKIEDIVLNKEAKLPSPTGGRVGRVTYAREAANDYIRHIKSTAHCSLDGMSIAIDCANGAASATAFPLFSELGADVHVLFDRPNGENINKDCGSTSLDSLSRYVRENGLDCGIAFDGDADRCLCVDENGNEVDGDVIMAICARDLKERGKLCGNTVVGTVMTNFGFERFCQENGIHFIATKVGDRYVLEELLLGDYSFGGEQSGHVIFRDFATTGDGQLTATQLLLILKRSGKKLSELSRLMTKYPQIAIGVEVSAEGKIAFYTDKHISESIEGFKQELAGEGRILVRPSGTEPLIRVMVEGNDVDKIRKIAERAAALIRERLSSK